MNKANLTFTHRAVKETRAKVIRLHGARRKEKKREGRKEGTEESIRKEGQEGKQRKRAGQRKGEAGTRGRTKEGRGRNEGQEQTMELGIGNLLGFSRGVNSSYCAYCNSKKLLQL
jgi:hypothetical protein